MGEDNVFWLNGRTHACKNLSKMKKSGDLEFNIRQYICSQPFDYCNISFSELSLKIQCLLVLWFVHPFLRSRDLKMLAAL